MSREVAGHTVVQPTTTGNIGDEFLENQAAPDCSRAFLIIFYFSHLFSLRFFRSWVPEAAEISSSPRADFKQTVSQTEEAHGISLLSVPPY